MKERTGESGSLAQQWFGVMGFGVMGFDVMGFDVMGFDVMGFDVMGFDVMGFDVMRECGDEVRELVHDGHPVACLGDAPFGYVDVFTSHVNVGFFHGASLPDPDRLMQGAGKFMRHVKLRAGTVTNTAAGAGALRRLIGAAWLDIKARVENG
jgi:Domain of unknown function (DU1801)